MSDDKAQGATPSTVKLARPVPGGRDVPMLVWRVNNLLEMGLLETEEGFIFARPLVTAFSTARDNLCKRISKLICTLEESDDKAPYPLLVVGEFLRLSSKGDLFDSWRKVEGAMFRRALTLLGRIKFGGPEGPTSKPQPCWRRAYGQFQEALKKDPGLAGEADARGPLEVRKQAYEWVKKHVEPGDPALPTVKTWVSYVGRAGKHYDWE